MIKPHGECHGPAQRMAHNGRRWQPKYGHQLGQQVTLRIEVDKRRVVETGPPLPGSIDRDHAVTLRTQRAGDADFHVCRVGRCCVQQEHGWPFALVDDPQLLAADLHHLTRAHPRQVGDQREGQSDRGGDESNQADQQPAHDPHDCVLPPTVLLP